MIVNENNEFKVQFHGACGRVTGSCYHLKFNHVQFLVDCGMVQGETSSDWENAKPFPFNPSEIKYVYLTHAHIDHSGLIPRLIKEGFVGEVRCTSATKEVARYLLIDTAKIMAKQPEISNLYSTKDVKKISWRVLDDEPSFKWGKPTMIESDLSVVYNLQSHVLGSISLTFLWPRKGTDDDFESIHFSGDIGNNSQFQNGQALLKPRQNPCRSTSFLVSETTYGGRHHSKDHFSLDFRLSQLKNHIDASIKNGKTKILIPAFAFHRTQKILFDLLLVFLTLFDTIEQAQTIATRWLWSYNSERTHKANHGYPPGLAVNMT
jgi:metallo-beta-lactamase family protein